MEAKL